jgi:hypothetical protein
LSKATLRQLFIVICLLSVVSDLTPPPPQQESPHRYKDVGGGRIATPPPPCTTTALAASPTPRRGSSFFSVHTIPVMLSHSSPLVTWPMINATGCGVKSSPSGGAVVPVWGHACRHRPGPGGPPCGGIAKGAAPGSGVGGGGGGGGMGLRRGCRRHRAWRNTPVSLLAGRRESRTSTCAGQSHGSANACALQA